MDLTPLPPLHEKAGTGTLDMIAQCRGVGLPEPDFEQRGNQFVVTLWRDWLTDAAMDEIGLSERQKIAVGIAKQRGRVTNREYQQLTEVSDRTVLRDLKDLVNKGVLEKVGTTGRRTYYVLRHRTRPEPDKPDIEE